MPAPAAVGAVCSGRLVNRAATAIVEQFVGTRLSKIECRTDKFVNFPEFVVLWNKTQHLVTPKFHMVIARWLQEAWINGDNRLLLMVFRDAGKSTLVGLFVSWLLSYNPSLRILILSADQALADKMSRNVRKIIETHPAARHLVPRRAELWTSSQFTVRRGRDHRDPSVLARGIAGNFTGTRADVVICDDVEVPRTCNTPLNRNLLRQRLAEISFVLVPTGFQIYIGTPHSYYSIYAEVARAEIGEEKPFLEGFRRLRIPLVNEVGESAWPERFPPAMIDALRREAGPYRFRSQMLLEPTPARAAKLDPDRLVIYSDPLHATSANGEPTLSIGNTPMVSSVCWWDPAYGRPGRGDRSAIAVVLVDRQGRYWLHALRYLQFSPKDLEEFDEATQLVRQAIAFAESLHQSRLFIEANGIGRFLPGLVRRELRGRASRLTLVERHSTRGKAERILQALDPILAASHLLVHRSVAESGFLEEMREWAPESPARDDGLDAVSGAILEQPVTVGSTRYAGAARMRPMRSGFHASTEFAI